jgi:hypothetical protein
MDTAAMKADILAKILSLVEEETLRRVVVTNEKMTDKDPSKICKALRIFALLFHRFRKGIISGTFSFILLLSP